MFDIFLYPVSAILWFWHTVFGALLSPDSGAAWVLAIVFLVFSIRTLLVRPALGQLRAGRRTQKLAPRMKKIREKYGKDRRRMAQEIQKLHADHGTSPFSGCLPALLQIPVFLSLYWVLRDFTPGATANHVFDQAGVTSFLNADLFGAKLGNWVSQPVAELAAFGTDKAHMLAVGIPLMLIASAATFLSMRMSLKRQVDVNPQVAGISKAMMYLAPAGMLGSGLFFPVPIGVLLYFLASNVWTFGQQHVLTAKVDREEAAATPEKPKAVGPRPGQKPERR
ncbi:membrane protein insertase YidC [Actinophytocola algeriensis]|uniref:Membrane protein insertase YidC n=1 Tax=Actinophytocola algeriensis TaxID=1768010 RepID=A0A7W7VE96_9PSEU|nr:membrane protein insertase YidC [Actinophytocola algeriensis]MBB4906780.1 YidC/Oxa1 family membrane protein insertase [Actinophytocola algeriensis]MBE1478261.1 YidC/Oxa1 family membrane protein insertase [Actinophytocola algeriensis]